MNFQASELVLDNKGRVYHLGISPEDLATKIIVVGDQDRVALVSSFFDTIEHQSQHREFAVHTGLFQDKRISVISTGIGTDNIDIVINELEVLANVDLHSRERKTNFTQLEIVRIGTCGILQEDIPVHSYIVSEAAIGLDNIAHFYEIPFTSEEQDVLVKIEQSISFPEKIIPYYITADLELTARFRSFNSFSGITVTSSGFYGPQGRQLTIPIKKEQLNNDLTAFRMGDKSILNFEMESSALFALSRAMNHKSTTICLGIANRLRKEFSSAYESEMKQMIHAVLEKI